jgi:hypothetical protein
MNILPPKHCLNEKCGVEIVKDQHCTETPDQFAERYNSGYCRKKCKREHERLHGPARKDRPKSTLSPVSVNHGRGGGGAWPKEKTPRNKHFLLWLLDRPCELRGGKFGRCMGDMIYHHTSGGGMALKGSDLEAISSCYGHHELFDQATKKGIGIFTEQELKRIIARNQMEYVEQGHKIKGRG